MVLVQCIFWPRKIMKIDSKKIRIFLQILGPLILIYILSKMDYRLFFEEVKSLRWVFLVFALIAVFFLILVKSLRWRTILLSLDIVVSKTTCLSLYCLGLFIGTVTPGRVGEVIKVYFLRNRGHSVFRSFFSVVFDRVSDILILIILGLLVFFFFLEEIGLYIVSFGVIVLLVLFFIFLLINQKSYLGRAFNGLIRRIFLIDLTDYNRFTLAKLWQGLKNLNRKVILLFSLYLIVGWFIYFLSRYFIALSLGLNLSFVDVSVISIFISMVVTLPISVAGLGTREAAVIYLFGLLGLTKETALAFSLLVFIIDIVPLSFGLIPYLRENFSIKKGKSQILKQID